MRAPVDETIAGVISGTAAHTNAHQPHQNGAPARACKSAPRLRGELGGRDRGGGAFKVIALASTWVPRVRKIAKIIGSPD